MPPVAATLPAGASGADAGVTIDRGPQTCVQATSSPLPLRLVARSGTASSAPTVVLVDDVFAAFLNACGQCHGPTSGMGSFQLATVGDFKTGMTDSVLAHAMSDEPVNASTPLNPNNVNEPMPPFGSPNYSPYSKRPPTDTVRVFAELAEQWLAAGSPNSFTPSQGQGDGGADGSAAAQNGLVLTPAVGDAMTNLGDCIPSKGLFAIETAKSQQLDAMFASLSPKDSGSPADMIGLPEHLADTDLFTFDSRVLAQYGVVAYAPGYPLWSDNAGKLRYVRVPRGTSIQFDKATQQFKIPPNTRFYKTFMKQIVDTDNSIRWRKIETRLILSRPDTPGEEGDNAHNAVYGTYRWNDDETDATLVDTPLRDGTVWADTVLEYNTDEPLAADLLRANPANPVETLIENKAARHYAIPSADRCNECHQGSANRNYVLGFLPVQINRRRQGEGGTIEPAGPDELTQLQRFIDYGLVTGIDSTSDILPLEKLEGDRAPRNNYELVAQGYLLGNCSHCHNPHGDPSVENPVLKTAFDLYPSATGGIFQWSLERYSPRIFRGPGGLTQMPYVTPSLMDFPRFDPLKPANLVVDTLVLSDGSRGPPPQAYVEYAPWRSLIFRNVSTAFSYTDDEALFPHMPRNTPGFDPRLPQIVSDWMVSIPSLLKSPDRNEYAFFGLGNGQPVTDEQPYAEVAPGDPRYADALNAAKERLDILHSGINPNLSRPLDESGNPVPSGSPPMYSNPVDTSDIIDPATLRDPICSPVPTGRLCPAGSSSSICDPPNHPHWASLDLSSPSTYAPRRTDWVEKMVKQVPDNISGCGGAAQPANVSAHQDEEDAISLLQSVVIDQTFNAFATTKIPYGTWEPKPGCDLSKQPTPASLGSNAPRWVHFAGLPQSTPLYSQSPGAAVYKSICINCHGPLADGGGRLSKNLSEMTGGLARPADFRNGLFGPVGATADTTNRHTVFGAQLPGNEPGWVTFDGAPVTDDDRAARYMAWMALGGTQVLIPPPILQIVSLTRVLGTRRPYFSAAQPSANMLSTAKLLCETLLGNSKYPPPSFDPHGVLAEYIDSNPEFIGTNGDAETWFKLCTLGHAAPVHVIQLSNCSGHLCEFPVFNNGQLVSLSGQLIDPATFPAGTTVGNPNASSGYEASLSGDNPWPWCVAWQDYLSEAEGEAYIQQQGWPLCPKGVTYWTAADASKWATRGAINAGLAVFTYLRDLETLAGPDPDYDQCDLLGASGSP